MMIRERSRPRPRWRWEGPLGLVNGFGVGSAVFPGKAHDHEKDGNHDEEHEPGGREQERLSWRQCLPWGEDFHVAAAKQHDRADAENARKGRKEGVSRTALDGRWKMLQRSRRYAARQQPPSYRLDLGQACDEWSHCLRGASPILRDSGFSQGATRLSRRWVGATICRTCTNQSSNTSRSGPGFLASLRCRSAGACPAGGRRPRRCRRSRAAPGGYVPTPAGAAGSWWPRSRRFPVSPGPGCAGSWGRWPAWQVVVGAALDRLDRRGHAGVAGDQQDPHVGAQRAKGTDQGQAGVLAQAQVHQGEGRPDLLGHAQRSAMPVAVRVSGPGATGCVARCAHTARRRRSAGQGR